MSFDRSFKQPHLKLVKSLIIDSVGTPLYHPKSKPFIDHTLCFYYHDNKIWVRHYQIIDNSEMKFHNVTIDSKKLSLMEIGPRFSMQPIKIFDSFMGGESIWTNKHYITPATKQREEKKKYEQ